MTKINSQTTISDLTNGKYSSLEYNSTGNNNYTGPVVKEILKLIEKTGTDIKSVTNSVDITFKDIIIRYQRNNNLNPTGVVDDSLLQHIYNNAMGITPTEIKTTEEETINIDSDSLYDAHYDPYFLNTSTKQYRRNHKDIIISIGDGAVTKTIKDVFMRSVSVQVDTSGNPISEVYSFIARDIKESDAPEDATKYIGEEKDISASSDIKYNYDTLFKDF